MREGVDPEVEAGGLGPTVEIDGGRRAFLDVPIRTEATGATVDVIIG